MKKRPVEDVPYWMITEAADRAAGDSFIDDADWHLDAIAYENEMFYGHAYPERDPSVVAAEQQREEARQNAVEHTRVLRPERFVDTDA